MYSTRRSSLAAAAILLMLSLSMAGCGGNPSSFETDPAQVSQGTAPAPESARDDVQQPDEISTAQIPQATTAGPGSHAVASDPTTPQEANDSAEEIATVELLPQDQPPDETTDAPTAVPPDEMPVEDAGEQDPAAGRP